MNTQLLEYVIAVAEEKSITKAADRMLVSQPAVSRRIAGLEEELGVRLFERGHGEMHLTDAGRIYLNGARSILNIYNDALSEIHRLSRSGRKQITLIYNNAILPDFAGKVLSAFRAMHGDVTLSTIDGNASVSKEYLRNAMADLAIVATGETSHSLLEYLPLREDELLLALPEDHPLVPDFREHGADLSKLSQETFILNQVNSHFRELELEMLQRYDLTPNILCEISDLHASLNMVIHHRGIAFLPGSMAGDCAGCALFPFTPSASFHVVIAYTKGAVLSPPIRDLIGLLLEKYRMRS